MASITRRSGRSRDQRRAELVAAMHPAVEHLLAEGESFTEASVERLVALAGISRSTFYVYFEDKGTLLLALAEDVMGQITGAARVWWDLPPDAGRDDLRDALRGIIDVYREHTAVWSAIVDASSYDPNVREAYRALVGASAKEVARHITAGQKAGSVRPELDAKRTATWLTWMTERGLYQELPQATKAEIGRICEAQTTIVWNTLYAGAPTRA